MNLTRTSLIALALAVGLGSQMALGEGWSLGSLNPFPSSSSKSASTHKASREPSTLEKMNRNTKQFFGKVGQTLSPSKPAPKKQPSPYNPWVKQTKKEKTSMFGSWFAPKEPPPPRSLNEWMELKPIRP
ncbi:MAG: hypothetical protein ABFD16_19565 [Thermoguttaceae bacterium]|jgi:hypothetical protein